MNKPWPTAALTDAALPVARPEVPLPGKVYRQIGVRLWGAGAYEREPIEGSRTKYAALSRVEVDDIIVNKIWARNGSVAVVPESLAGCYASSEFPTFAPIRGTLYPCWFHWLTKTREFWKQCDSKSRGTSGKNRIRPEKFLEIEIPLPGLGEQRRIVTRIEELAARIEEARGLRRQAVEDVEALVTRTLSAVYDAHSASYPVEMLGSLCETTSGGTPSRDRPDFYSGDIPWTKSSELRDGLITRSEEHISEAALASSAAKVFPSGTLLVALYGATVGRTGVLGIDAATNQAICAVFPHAVLDRDYVWWFLRRMRPLYLHTSFGGAQPNISQKVLRETKIPVPPLGKQHRIVAHLDDLRAKVDALKLLQAETAVELDAMLPSILDKAFKGEL